MLNTFNQLVESSPILMFSVDEELKYTYINPFFSKVHSISIDDAIGLPISAVIGEQGFRNNLPHYKKVLTGESFEYDSFFIKADGNPHYYHAIYTPLVKNEQVVGFTGVVIDTTSEKLLETLSNTDPLTKLYNRRKFDCDLNDRLLATSHQKCGLAILDIDFFKSINDDFGHDKGDEALINLANLLKPLLGDKGDIYRIGGEEFAVLFYDVSGRFHLLHQVETLRIAVERSVILSERLVTVSIGAKVINPGDQKSPLMKEIDDALYVAKDCGRNRTILV